MSYDLLPFLYCVFYHCDFVDLIYMYRQAYFIIIC